MNDDADLSDGIELDGGIDLSDDIVMKIGL